MVYSSGVTPYISVADEVKNSLVGACELFHKQYKVTNTNSKITHVKSNYSLIGILKSFTDVCVKDIGSNGVSSYLGGD